MSKPWSIMLNSSIVLLSSAQKVTYSYYADDYDYTAIMLQLINILISLITRLAYRIA